MSSLLCSPCSEFCVRCAILVYMAANDLTMLIYFLYLYVWLVLLTNFLSLFSLLVDHYFIFICLSPFTWIRVSGLRNSLSLSLNSALLADRYFYQCHCVRPQKENPDFRPLKKTSSQVDLNQFDTAYKTGIRRKLGQHHATRTASGDSETQMHTNR